MKRASLRKWECEPARFDHLARLQAKKNQEVAVGDAPGRYEREACRVSFRKRVRRHGSTLFVVLAVAAVASLSAFATLALSSSNRRQSELESSYAQTSNSLRSSLNWALESLRSDPNWRSTYGGHNSLETAVSVAVGNSIFRWYVVDPVDDDLTDRESDPVKVFAIGEVGSSRRTASAILLPAGKPLDVLRSPVHASGNLVLSDSVVVANGPLTCDGTLVGNQNVVFGSVESKSLNSIARIHHSSFTLSSAKTMPSELLFSVYKSIATQVDYQQLPTAGQLKNQIISNVSPPTNLTNQNVNGVYQIDVPASSTLKIQNCKITGTLLIGLTGTNSKLEIVDGVHWRPLRNDFPALIVLCEQDSGNTIKINSKGTFTNPMDGSVSDAHLGGVFRIMRPDGANSTTQISAENVFRGSWIVDGNVNLKDNSWFAADPDLMSNPPIGFQTSRDLTNLIENTGFEDGLCPWYPHGNNHHASGTRLERDSGSVAGASAVRVCGRQTHRSGIEQDVTRHLELGKSYSGSFWAKMGESDETIMIELKVTDDTGTHSTALTSKSVTTSWAAFDFNFGVSWNGELKAAKLFVHTSNSTQDFYLDQFSVPISGSVFYSGLDFIPSTICLE